MIAEPFGTILVLIIVIIFFVLIIGGAYLLATYFVKRRSNILKSFALKNGFTFQEKVSLTEESLRPNVPKKLSSIGWEAVTNYMEKGGGKEKERIFTYHCVVSGGLLDIHKQGVKFIQTVFSFDCPRRLPEFVLEREGLTQKVLNKVGFSDVNFNFNHDFSDSYVLIGKDENAIRKVFFQKVLNYFEKNKLRKNILHNEVLECSAGCLLVYRVNLVVKNEDIAKEYLKAKEMVGHFTM